MKVLAVYVKSFLTGLATLFAAALIAGIALIARLWSGGFIAVNTEPILVLLLLAFAAGFLGQYLRLRHKRSREHPA